MKKFHVLIIGAGPAGAVCGYLLKKAGVDCVIVDHATFPREKICGGGLTPKAYCLLDKLMPGLEYDYQGVSHAIFRMDGRTICEIDVDKELRMVRRKDFDDALVRQYMGIGGSFIRGSFMGFEQQEDGTILVRLKSGEELQCDYLVGADGANSQVRASLIGDYKGNTLWIEHYEEKDENAFLFEVSKAYGNGYFYRFPSVGRTVVGIGGTEKSLKDLKALLNQKGIGETALHGAYIPVETVMSKHEKIILIGDAGGFANKLTYEGLYYAIATAENAYKAIVEEKRFVILNRELFRKKRREVYLTKLFYSDFGFWLIRLGAHSPWLIKKVYHRYA
jgi:flavin-dependent dehydrogenase